MSSHESTDSRQIGASIRSFRIAAALSGVQLAERAGMSQSKVSKLETGRQLPSDPDLVALAKALRLPAHQREALIADVARVRDTYKPWSYVGPRLTNKSQRYIAEAERSATLIRECSAATVPGLLQTPGYTKSLLELLPYELDVSATMSERLARQQILFDIEDRKFQFLICEAALRTIVGSVQVMRAQLDRLVNLNESLTNLEIAILPSSAALPAPILSDFAIYDDQLVDVELLVGQVAIEEPASVRVYSDVFDQLWSGARDSGGVSIVRTILSELLEE